MRRDCPERDVLGKLGKADIRGDVEEILIKAMKEGWGVT